MAVRGTAVGEMEPAPETPRRVDEDVTKASEASEEEQTPACPWCDSQDVEMVSEYGPHLMVSQFICRGCKSPFEVIRR